MLLAAQPRVYGSGNGGLHRVGVAASSTNADGDVAFAVPPTITGNLVVIVDAVPPPLANIRVGDVIGTVLVAPNRESTPDKPSPEATPAR